MCQYSALNFVKKWKCFINVSLICLTAEQQEKVEEETKMDMLPEDLELRSDHIKEYQFPTYVPPNVKDDMVKIRNKIHRQSLHLL